HSTRSASGRRVPRAFPPATTSRNTCPRRSFALLTGVCRRSLLVSRAKGNEAVGVSGATRRTRRSRAGQRALPPLTATRRDARLREGGGGAAQSERREAQ